MSTDITVNYDDLVNALYEKFDPLPLTPVLQVDRKHFKQLSDVPALSLCLTSIRTGKALTRPLDEGFPDKCLTANSPQQLSVRLYMLFDSNAEFSNSEHDAMDRHLQQYQVTLELPEVDVLAEAATTHGVASRDDLVGVKVPSLIVGVPALRGYVSDLDQKGNDICLGDIFSPEALDFIWVACTPIPVIKFREFF